MAFLTAKQVTKMLDEERETYKTEFINTAGAAGKLFLPKVPIIFKRMGWPSRFDKEEISEWLASGDANDDFEVSVDEFVNVIENRPLRDVLEARIRRTFKKMDDDGDMKVTKTEVQSFFDREGKTYNQKKIDTIMAKFDTNADKGIGIDEFLENALKF